MRYSVYEKSARPPMPLGQRERLAVLAKGQREERVAERDSEIPRKAANVERGGASLE